MDEEFLRTAPLPEVKRALQATYPRGWRPVKLTREQSQKIFEQHGCWVNEICDRCTAILGPVWYTRRGEPDVFCSRECRGDAQREVTRKGGRPRKYKTAAEKQRAYRGRIHAAA